ncbi:TPA: IS3 family transposase [Streptococcus pyogenes]
MWSQKNFLRTCAIQPTNLALANFEEYIDYYNNKGIQVKIKWILPVQYKMASMCST